MVVTISNLKNAAKAAHYYEAENYYAKNEGIEHSDWYGKGALIQELTGKIKPQEFIDALHGKAANGTQLISERTNRRPGCDLTFSAPKSVSIQALVRGDQRIIEAHTTAVKTALAYVERELIQTRVTRNKHTRTLKTGNIQAALWQHDTSRQQDPQLHTHCVILNQTQCQDGKWRTIDNSEIFNHQLLVGAIYHNTLAHELQRINYESEWKADATFELTGYSQTQLASFSSRRNQIVALVGGEASAKKRALATLQTRRDKETEIDRAALQQQWRTQAQTFGIDYASYHREILEPPANCSSIIHNAQEILLERDVAFSDKQLLREALRQNQGAFVLTALETEIQKQRLSGQLLDTKDGRLTTAQALERERKIALLAKHGKAKLQPIATLKAAQQIAQSRNFTPGQQAALELAATSTDRVILIQGDAGTGKTYALNGLRELANNQQLRGLAPSAEAAVTLETESGISSQTLDSYLLSPNTPKGETLLLDEAGLMSSRQALALLSKVKQHECRGILIGDTKQLSSVESGCPFRLLQRAGIETAYMTEGRRQKDPELKAVIDLAAAGKIAESYQRLEQSGRIEQIAERQERTAIVASDYLSRTPIERSQTLVLTGTNQERDEITQAIRAGLLADGSLSQKSITVQTLKNKNIDSWSKKQAVYYELGDIVIFNVDYKNFSKREPYCVTGIDISTDTITLTDLEGKERSSSCKQNVNREVYQLRALELKVGEQGRFTKNNPKSKQINGQTFQVTDINLETEEITLFTKGWSRLVRAIDLAHADYNYVSTTYSAQGKTIDAAIWSVDTRDAKLLGKEAYYVAVSRVRHDLKIYTSNTVALQQAIVHCRAKANASELIQAKQEQVSQTTFPVAEIIEVKPQSEGDSLAENSYLQNETQPQAQGTQQSPHRTAHPLKEIILEIISQSQVSKESLLNLSDTEIAAKVQAVDKWSKTRPREAVESHGERLKNKVIELKQQKAKLETEHRLQTDELALLGKPRSLFNPFGSSAEILDYKQQMLSHTQANIRDVERNLSSARTTFKAWQQEAKHYLEWLNSQESQQMRQLSKDLETPEVQERLLTIERGYSLHNTAQFILKAKGVQSSDCRYFQGNFYRIEEKGSTLTIWHQQQEQPIYQAVDGRAMGGIVAINQRNFSQQDLENFSDYARYLKQDRSQQLQHSQRKKGFGIGD